MLSIVGLSSNKITLWIRVCVDDTTPERAIIASYNEISSTVRPNNWVHLCKLWFQLREGQQIQIRIPTYLLDHTAIMNMEGSKVINYFVLWFHCPGWHKMHFNKKPKGYPGRGCVDCYQKSNIVVSHPVPSEESSENTDYFGEVIHWLQNKTFTFYSNLIHGVKFNYTHWDLNNSYYLLKWKLHKNANVANLWKTWLPISKESCQEPW